MIINHNQTNYTVDDIVTDHEPEQEATSQLKIPIKPGRWHLLPWGLSDKVLNYIGDPDMLGYLSQISKLSIFKPSEECYRDICETTYLGQTTKGKLRIENWKSWRNMMINRPRLRVNGFYCLRTLYSRAPNNDNFWEPRRTQSVEVSYDYYDYL